MRGSIGSLNIREIANQPESVLRSNVAASVISTATLTGVEQQKAGNTFGIFARQFNKLTRQEGPIRYRYPDNWPAQNDDFVVRLF